ncbi:MAG: 16S rRNA (cytosine(1402)-N(4))-methyltransferase RsmH [Candidatus Saccharibacteria bacterium]
MHQEEQNHLHIPVLLEQTLQYLDPKEGDSYLDLTGGYGGHASAILERTKNPAQSVLVDRDANAVTELEKRFMGQGVDVRQADFYTASKTLAEQGRRFDLILADLGVSSPHLNQAERGFSISQDGPLDMRMDQTQSLTAAKIVNSYREDKLAQLIKRYGEDPKARQIASLIVNNRPYKTTHELATVVSKAWPGHSKVHPATRTFQALRIATNDELELLRLSLPVWIDTLLKPGGRIVVISFHSLEDRIVKNAFKSAGGDRYDATIQLLTKKPATGSAQELVFNPRARSAKLRAALKQK